jgi:hypothetical protein
MSSKNILAFNTVTGSFWGGSSVGFNASRDAAVAVDAAELAVLRATFLNVGTETLPELTRTEADVVKGLLPGHFLTVAEARRAVRKATRQNFWTRPSAETVEGILVKLVTARRIRYGLLGPRSARGYVVA